MRLNFEFADERVGDLKQLQAETGAESMKDLVNNALSLLEWAVKETEDGNEIAAVNAGDETYRVLVLPLLQRVAKRRVSREPAASSKNLPHAAR
ncbi:MAG: hypothetical protein ABSH02_18495 [Candidatus Sulfotelmatobacter sp.]|jgi:hypothetical protein